MHLKANFFLSQGDTKRGEGGLIKVKNKLTSKFISGDLKHFRSHVFFPLIRVLAGWVRTLNETVPKGIARPEARYVFTDKD